MGFLLRPLGARPQPIHKRDSCQCALMRRTCLPMTKIGYRKGWVSCNDWIFSNFFLSGPTSSYKSLPFGYLHYLKELRIRDIELEDPRNRFQKLLSRHHNPITGALNHRIYQISSDADNFLFGWFSGEKIADLPCSPSSTCEPSRRGIRRLVSSSKSWKNLSFFPQ
jgi:hypothetical protein